MLSRKIPKLWILESHKQCKDFNPNLRSREQCEYQNSHCKHLHVNDVHHSMTRSQNGALCFSRCYSFLCNFPCSNDTTIIAVEFHGNMSSTSVTKQDCQLKIAAKYLLLQGRQRIWLRRISANETVNIVQPSSCSQVTSCTQPLTPICPLVSTCSDGALVAQLVRSSFSKLPRLILQIKND